MKEIVSKKSGKIQVISDETWSQIVAKEMDKLFIMKEIVERKIKTPPEIIETKKPKHGEKN